MMGIQQICQGDGWCSVICSSITRVRSCQQKVVNILQCTENICVQR